ncbi:MAG: site-specific DNA-methyltransferase [Prevotella sp.]|nr:site-specific DNA-methyltransferase [Prevotella sp.]
MNIELDTIYNEDCLTGLRRMDDNAVDCCVTSPPYFALRDYGCEGQIGLEPSPETYISRLCDVFREVLRVLKPEGTCWVVIGDSYNCYRGAKSRTDYDTKWAGESGHPARPSGFGLECKDMKDKDLIGIPWMLAFALRGIGFYLRQDIIWHKPNPMPESVTSRCTKSHEYVFLLTKQPRYYFDKEALREPANTGVRPNEFNHRKVKFTVPGHKQVQFRGSQNTNDGKRNRRDVWSILVKPGYEGHHATFPLELPMQCIALGCPQGGVVLDQFMGTATTAVAALRQGRHYVGFELSPAYHAICMERMRRERQQTRIEFKE